MKTKPKRTGIKIQTVKENISVKYDEEEEVIGASDLFGGDDDYYEEYVEKTPIKKEEPVKQPEKEEEKVGEKTEEEKSRQRNKTTNLRLLLLDTQLLLRADLKLESHRSSFLVFTKLKKRLRSESDPYI